MYIVSVEDSIRDILLTPIGSRVCLPTYGSRLHELVDRRIDAEFKADITRYVFEAVSRWERRAKIAKVRNIRQQGGGLYFEVELADGSYLGVNKRGEK